MKYKLIVFDIDGTITRHISSWQLIHETLNLWTEQACIYQDRFLKGEISYKKFCQLDAACWKGMPESRIADIFKPIDYVKNSRSCIRKLKKKGFKLAAISTGLQYIADSIKKDLPFDFVMSNSLASDRGVLTGAVEINISHKSKGKALKAILQQFDLKKHEVIAVGDSAGDIPLAKGTGYSIAFNCSDKRLAETVDYNCKTIDFNEVYYKILSIC
jgi:phosphoserine phosphatase